jgi:hypothetical protein
MNFDGQYGALAVFGIAFIITVAEPRVDFPQIARPDRLTAQRTEGLAAGRPAIDHDESHVELPNAKRNAAGFSPRLPSGDVKSVQPSAVAVLSDLEAVSTFL